MTLADAKRIALGSSTAKLGEPTKMPGYSWGISAQACQRGRELAQNPDSPCAHCYARKNFYATWTPVLQAHRSRAGGAHHPRWADAMVRLIEHYTTPADPYFRWFDSGDLQGAWMLRKIVDVCYRTPWVQHWLPTHEPFIVERYARAADAGLVKPIAPNLCIRVSADLIDLRARLPARLEGMPTSTVHHGHGNIFAVQVSGRRADTLECKAYVFASRKNAAGICGKCRACWNPAVRNISYPIH